MNSNTDSGHTTRTGARRRGRAFQARSSPKTGHDTRGTFWGSWNHQEAARPRRGVSHKQSVRGRQHQGPEEAGSTCALTWMCGNVLCMQVVSYCVSPSNYTQTLTHCPAHTHKQTMSTWAGRPDTARKAKMHDLLSEQVHHHHFVHTHAHTAWLETNP